MKCSLVGWGHAKIMFVNVIISFINVVLDRAIAKLQVKARFRGCGQNLQIFSN